MKIVILSNIIATCLLMANFAQAQEAAPQVSESEFTYGLICTPDADLSVDQLQFFANNPNAKSIRESVQQFSADPKATISQTMSDIKAIEEKAKATLADPKYADQLNEMAKQYATEKNVTVEVALKTIVDQQVKMMVQKQIGGDVASVVANSTVQNCQMISMMKDLVAKSGCKNSAGAVIDMTASQKLCTDLEPQMKEVSGYQEKLAQIQADLQEYMAALQQTAQAKAQPYLQGMNETSKAIYEILVGLVGEQPAAQVPAAQP